jgi:hypothetical protein
MSQYRLTHRVSKRRIDQWAMESSRQCVCALYTPWWSLYDPAWMPYTRPDCGLPCDPRGSVLVRYDLQPFWQAALSNPLHYGSHGIMALVAAFHMNLEVFVPGQNRWRITSLDRWSDYNRLLTDLALSR